MSFFKFMTEKENNKKQKQTESVQSERSAKPKPINKSTIAEFSPKSYDEVAEIIDLLVEGKPAIVRLDGVSERTAQRVVDLLSGAIYAINGNLCELDRDLYIFTPNGVKAN